MSAVYDLAPSSSLGTQVRMGPRGCGASSHQESSQQNKCNHEVFQGHVGFVGGFEIYAHVDM